MYKKKINSILVLTPSYPGVGVQKADTPVVHYFVREWVKYGVNVRVIHYPVNFPNVVNLIAKPLKSIIEAKEGSEIRTWNLDERDFEIDGVRVKRIPLVKYMPHTRYSKNQIQKAFNKTLRYLESENFVPDIICSHWVNPQYELMHLLKKQFGCKTCYVAHDAGADLLTIYKRESLEYINETDIIGYRSAPIKKDFESNFSCSSKPSFMCYSGIPSKYVEEMHRSIDNVNTFIHVGTLLKRKYPVEIIPAVYKAFNQDDFRIIYVGTGEEVKEIHNTCKQLKVEKKVHLLGRLPREKVVEQMDKNSVFIMISKNEAFGLVYLEAMARGCITIASRNEGFDGIIKDGENGFLCKAGDSEELSSILIKLKQLPKEEWQRISLSAIKTAYSLTDEKVAMYYLNSIVSIIE